MHYVNRANQKQGENVYNGVENMSNQRKQIIVNEITFWKQNKLLPEHYCDFLMTLYTEGQYSEEQEKQFAKEAVLKKSVNKMPLYILLLVVGAATLSYGLFNFTSIPWLMPVITIICALGLMVGAFVVLRKNKVLAPVLQIAAALLIFMASIQVSQAFFTNNDVVLYILLCVNCALWLASGLWLKAVYFVLAGSIGLIFIAINFFVTL